MRVEIDKESHKHNFNFKHGEPSKKLTAKEIAQLRFYIDEARRNKMKYQIMALFISLGMLALLIWSVLHFINWLQGLPSDVYH
jgi:hypothetical protein